MYPNKHFLEELTTLLHRHHVLVAVGNRLLAATQVAPSSSWLHFAAFPVSLMEALMAEKDTDRFKLADPELFVPVWASRKPEPLIEGLLRTLRSSAEGQSTLLQSLSLKALGHLLRHHSPQADFLRRTDAPKLSLDLLARSACDEEKVVVALEFLSLAGLPPENVKEAKDDFILLKGKGCRDQIFRVVRNQIPAELASLLSLGRPLMVGHRGMANVLRCQVDRPAFQLSDLDVHHGWKGRCVLAERATTAVLDSCGSTQGHLLPPRGFVRLGPLRSHGGHDVALSSLGGERCHGRSAVYAVSGWGALLRSAMTTSSSQLPLKELKVALPLAAIADEAKTPPGPAMGPTELSCEVEEKMRMKRTPQVVRSGEKTHAEMRKKSGQNPRNDGTFGSTWRTATPEPDTSGAASTPRLRKQRLLGLAQRWPREQLAASPNAADFQERPQVRLEIFDEHTELFLALSALPVCKCPLSDAFPEGQMGFWICECPEEQRDKHQLDLKAAVHVSASTDATEHLVSVALPRGLYTLVPFSSHQV
eukprot:s1028_g10.t1